jgi:tartrate dehydratase beta subunit/fumarate hydratase class I family protein
VLKATAIMAAHMHAFCCLYVPQGITQPSPLFLKGEIQHCLLPMMVMQGNRSKAVTKACKQHGGFYLGSIGGPAAILAQNCIKKVEQRCVAESQCQHAQLTAKVDQVLQPCLPSWLQVEVLEYPELGMEAIW